MCMLLILSSDPCSWIFVLILHATYTQIVHAISVRRVLMCMLIILSSNSCSRISILILHAISKLFTRSRLAVSYVHWIIFCSSHSIVYLLPFCGEPRSRERFACSLIRIISCLPVGAFAYLSVRLSVRLFAYLRVHPFNSVRSFVCLSVCAFVSS